MHVEQEIHRLRMRVTQLERQIRALMERAGMRYAAPSGDAIPPEVHELALQGDKISAIKLYRECTGATLKEAKEAVESLG